jgi:hypothetical protein
MSLVHRNSASQCSGQAGQHHRENRTCIFRSFKEADLAAERSTFVTMPDGLGPLSHPSLAGQVYDSEVFSIN